MLVTDPTTGALVDSAQLQSMQAARRADQAYDLEMWRAGKPQEERAAAVAAASGQPAAVSAGPSATGPKLKVGAKAAFAQAGGQAGTGMGFSQFQKWYADFVKQTGGYDPVTYAQMSGLGYAGALTKPAKGQVYAGAGANVLKPGSNINEFYNPSVLSDAGELDVINRSTGRNYKTLQEAKNDLGLGFQFAGAAQYVMNQMRGGPKAATAVMENPIYQNASMVGLWDPSAMGLFLGGLGELLAKKGKGSAASLVAGREELVPAWAAGVQAALQAQGVPELPVSLIADPSIMRPRLDDEGRMVGVDMPDPSKPLFGPGSRPTSLSGFGSLQAGEASFLRSLSAEELLRYLAPLDWAYYHREAGAPAPSGFEAGLTFGSPVYHHQGYTPDGASIGAYERSPVQGLYGGPQQIGAGVLEAQGLGGQTTIEQLATGLGGGLYNRWTAYGYPGDYSSTQQFDPYADQQAYQDFWAMPNFAPWRYLDEETRRRLMALYASPTVPSAALA